MFDHFTQRKRWKPALVEGTFTKKQQNKRHIALLSQETQVPSTTSPSTTSPVGLVGIGRVTGSTRTQVQNKAKNQEIGYYHMICMGYRYPTRIILGGLWAIYRVTKLYLPTRAAYGALDNAKHYIHT
eukprot:1138702-Pelagomonas_calceolata.AAC.10